MTQSPRERYRLEQPLGRGGQGRTFRAVDTETGHAVAVKVCELRGAEGWKPFDLFERECQALRSLRHPGIPRYLDSFADEEAGKYSLVMELVEGKSLRELLDAQRSFAEAQLWNFLHQALEILDYLHGRLPPVIHRDIKPANLIHRPDGRLALVDFGGVRLALRPEGGSTVVGTFGYMAPEQLHGEAGPATDLYGLGATLATLAAGIEADKLPRRGLKIDLEAVMGQGPLRGLLGRLLEPDPEQRLSSVSAVREAIADRATVAAPSSPASRDGADPEVGPLEDVGRPLSLVIRLLGTLGYVGLTILGAVLLPLIFVMVGSLWASDRPDRRARLEQKKQSAHRALRSGRRAMRALARGQDPYSDELPSDRRRPELPPRRPRRRDRY